MTLFVRLFASHSFFFPFFQFHLNRIVLFPCHSNKSFTVKRVYIVRGTRYLKNNSHTHTRQKIVRRFLSKTLWKERKEMCDTFVGYWRNKIQRKKLIIVRTPYPYPQSTHICMYLMPQIISDDLLFFCCSTPQCTSSVWSPTFFIEEALFAYNKR